ncbi:molybdopterin synthase sulfur carrier subunit [Arenibacter nanhaiticus]|uniref:Molybdopterin synthase sulfur carrier subunit n=1 Tax=Arenibacter nanhaiticus TaxID=558155 RepID=A0A1M6FSN1_9FLAO|nr:MoaD/ThiS family protein [Arenibacter nanhaiticus]SHJ00670.1 molybdopterin synthase sulfur carrier subunit [Arenibacter nanhaiticus]
MTILLFGITKDIIGTDTLAISDSTTIGTGKIQTVRELKSHLMKIYPDLRSLSSLAVAVNNSYAKDDKIINNFDEIALIPPVSGG